MQFLTEKLFDGPVCIIQQVHITEGNGGVPGVSGASGIKNCTSQPGSVGNNVTGGFCRKIGSGGAYARITAWNETHLTYDHVQNNGGAVTDSWTIVQNGHGKGFNHPQMIRS